MSEDSTHSPTSRPTSRRLALGVVVVFLVLTTATGVIDVFFPVPRPQLIGAEKQRDLRLRERARFDDGSWARLVEHDLRLTSRVRQTLGSPYAFALFHLFRETRERLVSGRDGWLFLPGRALMPDRDDRAVAERSAAILAALERRLATLGIRLVAVPVPRKSVVYAESLPHGMDSRSLLDESLASALRRRGVEAVDLLSTYRHFQESRPRDLLYFQTGSHWTDVGQVLAAEEICRTLGILTPENARKSRLVSRGSGPQDYDHLRYAGLPLSKLYLRLLNVPEVETFETVDLVTEAPAKPRLALAGTSFSAHRKLPNFLSHCAQRPVLNAARAAVFPMQSLLELLRAERDDAPSMVVLEMPNHNVIGRRPLHQAGQVFVENPFPRTLPVLQVRSLQIRRALRGKAEIKGRLPLVSLPGGDVFHSADGVASLRLRGRVHGPQVSLSVRQDGDELTAPWPETQREVILPLVSGTPTANEILVTARGMGAIELESLDIVSALDEASAITGRRTHVSPQGAGWRQRLVFPGRPNIPRHAALLLELHVQGPLDGRSGLELVVITGEGPRQSLAMTPVTRKSKVLISLSAFRDQNLVAVVVRGSGAAPKQVVKRGLFLPPVSASR